MDLDLGKAGPAAIVGEHRHAFVAAARSKVRKEGNDDES
jgi:hypothetical protein